MPKHIAIDPILRENYLVKRRQVMRLHYRDNRAKMRAYLSAWEKKYRVTTGTPIGKPDGHKWTAKAKATRRLWLNANREKVNASRRERRARAYTRPLYWSEWPEEVQGLIKQAQLSRWRKNNPSYEKNKRAADPHALLRSRIHCRINMALKHRTKNLVGISYSDLRIHLESLFQPGMTWENRSLWHIDHIRPCSSFNLLEPSQQHACFHYTNLQPLWAKDNLSKSDKWEASA